MEPAITELVRRRLNIEGIMLYNKYQLVRRAQNLSINLVWLRVTSTIEISPCKQFDDSILQFECEVVLHDHNTFGV